MFIRLNHILIAISLIFAISVFSNDEIPNIKSTKSNDIKSVMFVGHSFFYYNNSLHNHLGKLIKADPQSAISKGAQLLSMGLHCLGIMLRVI